MNQFFGANDKDNLSIETKKLVQAITGTIREPVAVMDKNLKIISATNSFHKLFKTNPETVTNYFSEAEADQLETSELKRVIDEVISEAKSFKNFVLNLSSSKLNPLLFNINANLLGHDNLVIVSFKKIIDQAQHKDNEKYYLSKLKEILANAPAMICSLKGSNHIFEIANEKYYQLIGKKNIIGKAVREVLPEVENQGFFKILDEVYNTGRPYIGNEISIELKTEKGETKNSYLDFVYQPTFGENGEVEGIFVHVVDVTEKVQVRKKVEQNELRLLRLIDTIPAIIWITDKEGHSTYLNEKWYNYTGQKTKDAEGHGWINALHPDDRKRAGDLLTKATKERATYHFTYRLQTKSGEYRWVLDSGNPKYDMNGEFEGMVGSVIEVHEEKMKEQEIREKEHRIRSIVEEAAVATAVYTGEDLKIELANNSMIELWGKDKSLIGKKLTDALPELEGQPFVGLLKEVYTTGKMYWGKEDRVDLMIGNEMQTGYFNFTYKPLRDEKGNIYGILNMAIDVTEMVKSKLMLKERESYFRQMADLMPDKVISTDSDGNFVYFNQNWEDYSGFPAEELNEKFWSHLMHPEDREHVEKTWVESLKAGVNFETEIRFLNKYGKYKWHLSRAEAVRDETGKITTWIGTNTEIHKLKEEEKRKEDFLKMVSHELKTPVTSIKGYVQLLLTLVNSSKEFSTSKLPLKPSLERIDHQIVRLTRLISEMLDLSRLEENKLELQKENFSINDLVIETVQDITYTNTHHHIEIEHEYRCNVFADKDRIGQVLINFITNAIKYSPESRDIHIKINKAKNNQVAVSVRDHGIGIEKKNHRNIFKRFYRIGGKSEETYAGFGIGLYLANEIIQRHDGAINVKSKKGKGSDFCFTLSVAKE